MSGILRRAALALSVAVLAAGCATPVQAPVDLPSGYLARPATGRVGVLVAQIPKPDTSFPGAYCLLCVGVANAVHSKLNTHVQSLSTDELKPLGGDLAALLKNQGLEPVLIEDSVKVKDLPDLRGADLNKARKDFSSLKTKYKIDRLLIVDLTALGVWRSYSAYVPTDVPKAVLYGSASLVDLGSNSLDWFLPLQISRAADGEWDEPPAFPGLTNAYFQVLESAMDQVKKPFVK